MSELARRVGIQQQIINRLITGKNTNPKLETIQPIASYFLVTISQLIGDEPLVLDGRVSITHQGWQTVPLIDINKISQHSFNESFINPIGEIKTDIEISIQGFAVIMNDNSMGKEIVLVYHSY